MKKTSKRSVLGLSSIIAGLFLSLYYFFGYFYVNYFTSLGWPDFGSSLGLSLLLLIGGVILFSDYSLGSISILGFIFGNIFDRITIFICYNEQIFSVVMLLPTASSIVLGIVWLSNKERHPTNRVYIGIVFFIILLAIFLPKVPAC